MRLKGKKYNSYFNSFFSQSVNNIWIISAILIKILRPVVLQYGIPVYAPAILPPLVPVYRPPPPISIMAPVLVAVPSSEEKTTTTKKPRKKNFKIVYPVFPSISCKLNNKSKSLCAVPALPSIVASPPLALVPVPAAKPARPLRRCKSRKKFVCISEESSDSNSFS